MKIEVPKMTLTIKHDGYTFVAIAEFKGKDNYNHISASETEEVAVTNLIKRIGTIIEF